MGSASLKKGFVKSVLHWIDFRFLLPFLFFYAIIEQAVPVHSECGIFNAKEKYCTFSSYADTTCRGFFYHSLDLHPYHSLLTNITVRVTEINSTWGNYVYLRIHIYCFVMMVVKFATPSVPFWTKKNKVQRLLYAHYVAWLWVTCTWGPPDAGPACQRPKVTLG